jgi:hypothetical protein
MQNNPYDDLLKSLAKLLEQMSGLEQNMRFLQGQPPETPRIIGCAIITGGGNGVGNTRTLSNQVELPYELVDAGDTAYMTIQLPSSITVEPGVTIQEEQVIITAAQTTAPVTLGFRINPAESTCSVRNGVIDLVLAKVPAEELPEEVPEGGVEVLPEAVPDDDTDAVSE